MTTEFAAIRKELKGLGVRNSFRGATKNYMAELLNRRKHNTGVVPPQLLTAEALRMARGTEYRELLGKRSLENLALHLPARLWKHYKKFGWLQLDLSLSEREKRMVALCHRVALCELVRREPYTKALRVRSLVCAARRPVGHTGCRPDRHVDVCRERARARLRLALGLAEAAGMLARTVLPCHPPEIGAAARRSLRAAAQA